MTRGIDRTGQKFGRLTVVALSPKRVNRTSNQWLCLCECGNETIVDGGELKKGKVKSCGCLRDTQLRTHGMSKTKVYRTWVGMKKRILNPKEPCYDRYGGRGLTIEKDWIDSFEAFYADVGDPPTEKHSFDRVENSLGYVRGNCRWATTEEQANNTRKNVFFEHQGRSQTLAQWAREYGISPHTLFMRVVAYKWSLERALATPVRTYVSPN